MMKIIVLFILVIFAFEMYEKGMFDWLLKERFQLSPYHTIPPIPDKTNCENSSNCANFAYNSVNDSNQAICAQCDPREGRGLIVMSRQPGLVRQPRKIL